MRDAHEAATFYASTFQDSRVTAVHKSPSDFPGGKKGDELTVEFTDGKDYRVGAGRTERRADASA